MTVLLETNLPNRYHHGKVRDMYSLGDVFLMVVTDRISAFDVVLPVGIPHKGRVLAELSAFWFQKIQHLTPHHLIALAREQDQVRRAGYGDLSSRIPDDLASRSMLVKKAERVEVECVVRGYLTGSAWSEYRQRGTIGGMPAPTGYVESQRLPEPLFTPTTKAEVGHDETLTHDQLRSRVGSGLFQQLMEASLRVYAFAHEYALGQGIIIADTKLEFGFIDGELSLIDELLTPDSSRFWEAATYAPGQPLPSFDKQIVRDWLTHSGWNREPPAPALPAEVIARTSQRYLEVYQRLTGKALEV